LARVQGVFQEKSRPQGIVRNFPFTNLLTCGSPSCQCQITAEIHKGQYVYYRCTKGRGREVCDNDYIRQEQLDALLGGVVRDIQIPAELAQELHKRLKKELGQLETTQASRQQSVELRRARLQANLDKAYEDRLSGAITEEFWKRKSGEWQAELATLHTSPQTLDAKQVMTTAEFALELAQSAHSQYVTRNLAEKRELLQILVSNCTYHRGNLIPTYKKPFDIFAEGWEKQKWRGRRDSNSRPPT
jgi:site-specific DNA recombinase